jgi:hypothetical protein
MGHEITRVGKGRYALPPRTSITPAPPQQPVAPIAHQAAPAAREPEPRKAMLDSHEAMLRDQDRELIERKLGIKDDAVEATRPPEPMDVNILCAMIGCRCGKAGVCTPARLRGYAQSWIADGLDPQFCLGEIDRFLQHAPSRSSGSIDRLMPHLNARIRHEWANRHATGLPTRRLHERPTPGNALDDWDQYAGRANKRVTDDTDGDFGGM